MIRTSAGRCFTLGYRLSRSIQAENQVRILPNAYLSNIHDSPI